MVTLVLDDYNKNLIGAVTALEPLCKENPDYGVQTETAAKEKDDPVVLCRLCHNIVTKPSHQIVIDNQAVHTFANPHGHVFEIVCFSRAQGFRSVSSASSEFSWFRGYSWHIGICTRCAAHLGWKFVHDHPEQGNAGQFYGLILDKLIIP